MISKTEMGSWIKQIREDYGRKIGMPFNQADLARKTGLTRGHISDLEAGRSYPSFEKLQAIAAACDVPLNIFSSSAELEQIPSELKEIGVSYIAVAKELKDKGLSPDEIRKLADIANMFRNK